MSTMTVVICTFNPDADQLLRAIDSISCQLDDVDGEFLIVDNNSKPPLRSRGMELDPRARIIEQPVPGLTAAREAAFNAASGELIVFVDDDNVLDRRYLETAVRLMETYSDVAVLGGSVDPDYETQPPPWFSRYASWVAIRPAERGVLKFTDAPPVSESFPIGAGLVVRTSLARDYLCDSAASGKIEGRRGTELSSGEDLDLSLFALSQGHRLLVSGDLRVSHSIPTSRFGVDYLASLGASNVTSAAQLDRKWRERFADPIFEMFGSRPRFLTAKARLFRAAARVRPELKIRAEAWNALAKRRDRQAGS